MAAIQAGATRFGIDQQPFLQGYSAVEMLMLKVRYGITPVVPIMPTGPSFVDAGNVAIVEALAGQYR
jgi:simple sugar transport system substrate-binding protein